MCCGCSALGTASALEAGVSVSASPSAPSSDVVAVSGLPSYEQAASSAAVVPVSGLPSYEAAVAPSASVSASATHTQALSADEVEAWKAKAAALLKVSACVLSWLLTLESVAGEERARGGRESSWRQPVIVSI